MSWFDKIFGKDSKPTEQQPDVSELTESQHIDIYRRPRGKFRFPIDLGDDRQTAPKESKIYNEPESHIEDHRLSQQFVNDEYFARRRARKGRVESEKAVKREPERPYKENLPPGIPEKRSHFTASEVPSAIFGSRRNLQPSDAKVVITPLTGKKSEQKKPEVPTHRQQDNVVNVENIYASQIVAEIRKEREKKLYAKKAFEEARRQQKEQENLVKKLTSETGPAELEVETIGHREESYMPLEVEEIVNETSTEPYETIEKVTVATEEATVQQEELGGSIETEPESEPEQLVVEKVVFTAGTAEESAEAEQVESVAEVTEPEQKKIEPAEVIEAEPEWVIDTVEAKPVVEDVQQIQQNEVTEQPVPQEKRKTSPFNVLMTPSDKKRLMNRAESSASVHTEPVQSAETPESEKVKRKGPKYLLPPVSLLSPEEKSHEDVDWVAEQRQQLDDAFYHFNVPAKVEEVVIGPSVTRYELSVEKGVKVSRITNLQDDIKMALAAKEIRIEAPIPGTSRVGVEVPNVNTRKVNLSEVIFSKRFKFAESKLMVALGAKINNEPMLMDIAKMPHALIAGATGSGKSVSINAILLSLLYRNNPSELKLLLIDPKMVELAPYNDLPHLIAPVITDVKAATESLKWVVEEMERRYKVFSDLHVRNITAYNQKSPYDKRLPKIVIVIDELADLMMMAPQDVEHSIARIAQKARAAGIHMILATQRPSVNVITGLIKANVPTRIAFMVSSSIDSRTILDNGGAEKLLGNGDMLYQGNGMNKPIRIQGCYVSDEEIDDVVASIKDQTEPDYLFQEKELLDKVNEVPQDELFDEVLQFMLEEGHISTSQLQRRFQIGYNRAARIIDSLETMGYISGANGSKPRTVLVNENQL
ncbi:DNA translocase FtsK [Macrococcus carouselicus]|uniref:DNA translocase FtsK n=1 Tax=Macrococcus carouselicus TaxID=69969 RepID=A0A9Q8FPR0_9STAP|nr:DNA translocase FtsK [Macrococcus carouselicus]TDM04565.1 DNA translocase FtsK [Macrococcus carouselicus]